MIAVIYKRVERDTASGVLEIGVKCQDAPVIGIDIKLHFTLRKSSLSLFIR